MKVWLLAGAMMLAANGAYANCIDTGGNCTAGNSGPTAQSAAKAKAKSQSRASSSSIAQGGNARGGDATAYGGRGGQGGQGGNVVLDGVGNSGIARHADSAYAAPITSFNPCAGAGVSLGMQVPMLGLSGGAQGYDNACRLHQLGLDVAAREYLCKVNSDVREAMFQSALMRSNMPCLADLDRLNKAFSDAGQPPAAMVNARR